MSTHGNINEEEVEEQAAELRAALDDQLELVRRLSLEEQLEWSVDEQLAQLIVIVSAYSEEALKKAILRTHPAQETNQDGSYASNYSGRLPIHLACDTSAPIEIIRWLLDQDPQRESILRKDKWGDLPLHTACSRKDVEVVRLLLEKDQDKTSITTKDNYGSFPLHMACRYNAPAEAIRLLLDGDPSKRSLLEPGMYDQLPLHIACRCNLPPETIQLLCDYDPTKQTLLTEDNAGRLPLHVAYLRNSHNSVIQILLQAMLYHRIERIGLDNWKRDMRQWLKSMETHERDFNTRDKLELTRDALLEFLERSTQLELAVWKASCLTKDCQTLQEVVDSHSNDSNFDLHHYKMACRIKAGVEVVLPHVLAFLEDEPIVKLLAQFA